MKKKLGNNISFVEGEPWKFDDAVAKNFDAHIVKSIPHYKSIQNYISKLSEWFLKDKSRIYDLGCSSGNTILNISQKNYKKKKLKFVCIDLNKKMLAVTKKKVTKFENNNEYMFIKKDITKIKKFNKHDLCLSILFFPFISKKEKFLILKRINRSLNYGGAMIIVDKINSDISICEDMFNQIYFDFKSESFTKNEIFNKAKSLRSSLKLSSNQENIEFFRKSGFKKFEKFFRWFNFCGYILFK